MGTRQFLSRFMFLTARKPIKAHFAFLNEVHRKTYQNQLGQGHLNIGSYNVIRCLYLSNSFCSNVKSQLVTMKLSTPQFQALFTPEVELLIDLFKKYNYELRISGGAVRDLLLDRQPHDVDFATTATPEEMKAMFERENIRMLNTRGEKHGTITCRINEMENFEVTTLRIDVVTDGRHAEVEFTRDWEQDALRRDLTVNAMFLGFDGTVYDYFGGLEDLQKRKVDFVGNATDRIQEDYLRVLRYFRFYGRIATNPNDHESRTLEAIQENMNGLARISGERIWLELKRIVTGNHSDSLITTMMNLGMAPLIGFPQKPNVEEFSKVFMRCRDLNPSPMTLLAALMDNEEQVYALNERLKLSREELRLSVFIIQRRTDDFGPEPLHYCKELLCDLTGKEPKTKEKIIELLKYLGKKEIINLFEIWQLPKFPITGILLLERGVEKGPKLAKMLSALRQKWKESEYTYTQDDLLEFVEELKSKTK